MRSTKLSIKSIIKTYRDIHRSTYKLLLAKSTPMAENRYNNDKLRTAQEKVDQAKGQMKQNLDLIINN